MPGPSLEGRCGALWHTRPVGFYSGCRTSTGFVDATPMREVVGVCAAGAGGASPVLVSGGPGPARRPARRTVFQHRGDYRVPAAVEGPAGPPAGRAWFHLYAGVRGQPGGQPDAPGAGQRTRPRR